MSEITIGYEQKQSKTTARGHPFCSGAGIISLCGYMIGHGFPCFEEETWETMAFRAYLVISAQNASDERDDQPRSASIFSSFSSSPGSMV